MGRDKDISGKTPGGKRVKLADALPLDTPFLLYVFPIYACNFKCKYCIFSVDKSKRGFISDKVSLDLDLFKRCIDDAKKFPRKFKVLRFVGMGEPLMHKDIAEMVKYTVEQDVADVVEILTNGSLLTHKISDTLIDAGLTRLVISLQGTSSKKYAETSDVNIDFYHFIANIRYFYEHKKNTHVYVKVVDTALDGKEDEQRFYDIFGDVCDNMAIEHTVPIYPGVNYDTILKNQDLSRTQFQMPVSDVKICPQPFFTMQINPDGKVVPCFSLDYPEIIADCNQQSIYDIWSCDKFQQFRRKMLKGAGHVSKICSGCNIIKYRMSPEDVLEEAAPRLKVFYQTECPRNVT